MSIHKCHLPTELGLFGLRLGCAEGLAMVIYDLTLVFDALTSRSLLWSGRVNALKYYKTYKKQTIGINLLNLHPNLHPVAIFFGPEVDQ